MFIDKQWLQFQFLKISKPFKIENDLQILLNNNYRTIIDKNKFGNDQTKKNLSNDIWVSVNNKTLTVKP